jgi:hypothetical protein
LILGLSDIKTEVLRRKKERKQQQKAPEELSTTFLVTFHARK